MDLKNKEQKYIINTYNRQPDATLFIKRGEGVYVWDEAGNRFLDFVSGLAVNNLGHCHPTVVEAVKRQTEKLMHTSNLYYTEPQIRLAEQLVAQSCADKVFFCNSGAEANEAAIKLARKFGKATRGCGAHEIITAQRSFHGRTLAAITATAQPKYHQGFEPMVAGFHYAEYNNLDSFAALVNENTCAILVEPIQGEGGVYPAQPEFLQGLRKLCDEHGLLLIFDEVQSGIGRTGKLLAYENYGVEPDVYTLAKGLGGGLPIGVMAARGAAADTLVPGDHASTFGGNPVVCAAAGAVLQVLGEDGFLEHVQKVGQYFMDRLQELTYANKVELRGLGLFIGLEISGDGAKVASDCQKEGLLLNCIGGKTLRFLPPLIVEEEHIDAAVNVLQRVLARLD
ncbi:acetylornithine transaminase [Dethiobacter alkaliphilus]|uniref:Acetylornithine aminotransferase n=1 Tax=Dethiobacter alkaliphilus AHT 1 TaxID=555088 RepID=C0GH80_DETAL|nr:acetylornithine transaminase [Dethiobacter alkaliphilus]EEG77382.1 acetylornithine and succinylornithine aminotransferase [Dethiobacter alkaliphilus AHT 1]